MKTLYLDLGMGAAGDMLTAALLELTDDPDAVLATLNAAGIPGVEIRRERAVRCGIAGTRAAVTVHGEEEGEAHEHAHAHPHGHGGEYEHAHPHDEDGAHHHHGSPAEIAHLVREHLALPEAVRQDVLAVYGLLAEAESRVHGVPVTDIHFHEVGTMDALADIAAVCLLMAELRPDEVVASPVHVGAGQVKCAHGLLPVPAPAAAELLKGVPTYGGKIEGELCTPTGAALLKRFVTRFGDAPVMRVEKIGYGMGKKEFAAANCVRAMLGETEGRTDAVYELACNVDDMTAEEIGFALGAIFAAGAREAFTLPAGMKKNRPGTLICAICDETRREAVLRAIFRHTSTLGVRETAARRYILDRETETLQTAYGPVRRKRAAGWGAAREKYEYDDLARIAEEKGIGLHEARALVEASRAERRPD